MLEKLKKHWKLTTMDLVLVLVTFAVGGSACGWLGRNLLSISNLEGPAWLIVYLIVVTLLWPICVILVSIPLGQFAFFKKYLTRIWKKMSRQKDKSTTAANIAIFASGAGTNAQNIINHFRDNSTIKVALIFCNKPGAGVLTIAADEGIPSLLVDNGRFFKGDNYIKDLEEANIELIVLAGFLWKLPDALVQAYPKKIINIHPALLPKHGGKGMYGQFVHEAVISSGDTETGISIHYVDEYYDHGAIIFQEKIAVEGADTPASLAQKIQVLEHQHYPQVIESLLKK